MQKYSNFFEHPLLNEVVGNRKCELLKGGPFLTITTFMENDSSSCSFVKNGVVEAYVITLRTKKIPEKKIPDIF